MEISKERYEHLRTEFNKPSFKKYIKRMCGNFCHNCYSDDPVEYHHIVPLINGGSNDVGNIVPLCEQCHYKAHDKSFIKGTYSRNGAKKGRKSIISYQDAEGHLRRYFNLEIGTSECKKLLGISQNNKSTWYKLKNRYIKENNVPDDFRNSLDLIGCRG